MKSLRQIVVESRPKLFDSYIRYLSHDRREMSSETTKTSKPKKTSSDTQISDKLSETWIGEAPTLSVKKQPVNSIYWFRKALRLHDNPALNYAVENSDRVYPVFILDPYFVRTARVGANRWRFLVESLQDLDNSLRTRHNSRLLVVRGQPLQVLREKFAEWNIGMLCFESDTEPYAKKRDAEVRVLARECGGVRVETRWSNTLYEPGVLYTKNGNKVSYTYQSFLGLMAKVGEPNQPVPEFTGQLKPLDNIDEKLYLPPGLGDLLEGAKTSELGPHLYPGGESEALRRMEKKLANEAWVSAFEKPNTSPNSLQPSTTVLSPYLKFGCLSPKLFYHKLKSIYGKHPKHSEPPVSLEGQLIWREFFYFCGTYTPNFDRIEGNPICRKIKWDDNPEYLK